MVTQNMQSEQYKRLKEEDKGKIFKSVLKELIYVNTCSKKNKNKLTS